MSSIQEEKPESKKSLKPIKIEERKSFRNLQASPTLAKLMMREDDSHAIDTTIKQAALAQDFAKLLLSKHSSPTIKKIRDGDTIRGSSLDSTEILLKGLNSNQDSLNLTSLNTDTNYAFQTLNTYPVTPENPSIPNTTENSQKFIDNTNYINLMLRPNEDFYTKKLRLESNELDQKHKAMVRLDETLGSGECEEDRTREELVGKLPKGEKYTNIGEVLGRLSIKKEIREFDIKKEKEDEELRDANAWQNEIVDGPKAIEKLDWLLKLGGGSGVAGDGGLSGISEPGSGGLANSLAKMLGEKRGKLRPRTDAEKKTALAGGLVGLLAGKKEAVGKGTPDAKPLEG